MRRLFEIAAATLLIAALGGSRQGALAQQQPNALRQAQAEPASGGAPPAPYTTQVEQHLMVHADLSATEVVTKRLKILVPGAIQTLSQQKISFIDGMQTLEIVEAYTEKADGRHATVPPASIITQDGATGLQATYLRDLKQKTIIFPDVGVGDTLVLTTREEQRQGMYSKQFADIDLLPRSQSVTAAEVTIDAPVALDLRVKTTGRASDDITVTGSIRHHRIVLAPEPYRAEEPDAVSPLDREPMIVISTFKSYEEIGRAYGKAALPKAAVTPQVAALANEITRGIVDRKAQATAIDAWMKKNIRYVAVYLSLGRVVPNEAATVLMNKFGDCKDKVTLMSALLAAKGIASETVLLNLGNTYTLPDPPEPAALNHAILYLPDFDLYDDPTLTEAAFGVLAAQAQDKPVIRVSAAGAKMARTPAMRPDANVAHAVTTIKVAADGTVTGETKESNTGMFGVVLRAAGRLVQSLGDETAASRELQARNSPGTGHFDLGNIDATTDPAIVTGSFTLNDKFKAPPAGTRAVVPVGMPLTVRPGTFLLGNRLAGRQSAFVCYAGRQIEDIKATFDAALPMPQPLVNANVDNPSFTYRSTYAVQGRTLTIHREFVSRVPGQVCSPAIEAQIAGDMNIVRTDTLTSFAFAAGAAPAATSPPQTIEAARVATAGQKRAVDFVAMLNVDCASVGLAAVRVVQQPQHGVAAVESGFAFPNYPQSNPRSACNKQRTPGTLVTYQSQPDFTGTDSVTVEVTLPGGGLGRRHYTITVNPAPTAAAAPPSGPQTLEIKRAVAIDHRLQVQFLYDLNPDCSSIGFATVRVVEPPMHGKVTSENGTGFSAFPQTNTRSACNNSKSDGVNLWYDPDAGYAGADSFAVDVIYADGNLIKRRYAIDVR